VAPSCTPYLLLGFVVITSDSLELGTEVGHKQCVQIVSEICLDVDSYKQVNGWCFMGKT
jgi:hypothetical protein